MSENTNIEWCDHTFNPWEGCTKVGPGCDHCYAETRNSRFNGGKPINWGPGAPRRLTSAANWRKPRQWQAQAAEFFKTHGRRQRVFCASLADVFDNQVPTEWRDDLWRLIEATPDLDWLLLTKRIGNVGNMLPLPFDFAENYPHVWIGATITSQPEAERDILKLLEVDARVHFLSMEPLLGPVDFLKCSDTWFKQGLAPWLNAPILTGIDWIIAGGESGPGARPMHPDWARSLRDQCAAVGVPFLFKQWGEWLPWHHFNGARIQDELEYTKYKTVEWIDGEWRDVGYPDCWDTMDGNVDDMQCMGKVGKKAAGRLLDGVEHNGYPEQVNACTGVHL